MANPELDSQSTRRSRFQHKLFLVLLDNRDGPAIRQGRSLWALQKPMTYLAGPDRKEVITVPAGFVTDLTSIPRFAWTWYPPDGPWVKAAIVHDFLYDTAGKGRWFNRGHLDRTYTRREADQYLKEGMEDRGVGGWERNVIYGAVRLFGGRPWREAVARQAERLVPREGRAEEGLHVEKEREVLGRAAVPRPGKPVPVDRGRPD